MHFLKLFEGSYYSTRLPGTAASIVTPFSTDALHVMNTPRPKQPVLRFKYERHAGCRCQMVPVPGRRSPTPFPEHTPGLEIGLWTSQLCLVVPAVSGAIKDKAVASYL